MAKALGVKGLPKKDLKVKELLQRVRRIFVMINTRPLFIIFLFIIFMVNQRDRGCKQFCKANASKELPLIIRLFLPPPPHRPSYIAHREGGA
jgi:uncharacterized integral membrane protein